MMVETAYHYLYLSALVVLSILTLLCLLRAILGPRIPDRIVSINMISTLTIAMICVLAMMQNQGFLADVALIYALIGFLAVVVICKVYMGIALERREKAAKKEDGQNA